MRHIKIPDHATLPGQEYRSDSYPGQGCFFNRKTRMIYIVSGDHVVIMPVAATAYIESADAQLAAVALTSSPNFSEDFVLRALAIAQSPQLATALLAK